MTTFRFSATSTAPLPVPSEIFRIAPRFFSTTARNFASACASAAPVTRRTTCGGVHSAFACMLASHLALHSALICGGSTFPVHFGACISTEHEPLQVPLHSARPLMSPPPPPLPLHSPFIS